MLWLFLTVCLFPDVAQVRRLEEEAVSLARILDEKEKEAASLALALEEKKKEPVARDRYDKALTDRLSIVAEGLAGNFVDPDRRASLFCIFGSSS